MAGPGSGGGKRAALVLCGVAMGWLAAPVAAQAERATSPILADKTPEWLIETAVLAAPVSLRDDAEVRAWSEEDRLVTLRGGGNGLICIADRPGDDAFSAACYHESLEPFMARGRELRRQGLEGMDRQRARWEDVEAGRVPMPAAGMVYNLGFPSEDLDPADADPAQGRRLHAIYMSGATTESTGLPTTPGDGPWLMFPGTPSAHVMVIIPPAPGG